MQVNISPEHLNEIKGITSAGKIHVRETSTIPGADFKLPETVKALLLENSGKTFTVKSVDVRGTKGRGTNITKKDGTKTSIPNGKFDVIVIVDGTFSGVSETVKFKTTLAEIATANEKGELVLIAQVLGRVEEKDKDTQEMKVVDAGNVWVHGENVATAEQQMQFLEKVTATNTAKADKPTV